MEIEAVVKRTMRLKRSGKVSAHDFSGLLSEKDASLMDTAIEEGCEQINQCFR